MLSKSYLAFTVRTMCFFGSLLSSTYLSAAFAAVSAAPIHVSEPLSWRFPFEARLAASEADTVHEDQSKKYSLTIFSAFSSISSVSTCFPNVRKWTVPADFGLK